MTFNTGNNVPSTDPRDLYDNAENLDKLVNGAEPFYADRKGKLRESWAGMENSFDTAQEGRETTFGLSQIDKEDRFQAFLVSSGYIDIGPYEVGIEFTARNQYVAVDGQFYRPSAATDLPYTATGDWETESGNFVLLGDDVLRQELAGPNGAALIGGLSLPLGSVQSLREQISSASHAETLGYYAPGDGGAGLYYLDAEDSSSADNGGTVIVAADGGRWKLNHNGSVDVRQFGAKSDGTDDSLRIQAAIDSGLKVNVSPGDYGLALSQSLAMEGGATVCCLVAKDKMVLQGAGRGITKFRLIDNESTDADPKYFNMIGGNTLIDGLVIDGITFDLNGQNNKISPERDDLIYNYFNCAALMISGSVATVGVDARLTNARFTNNAVINSPGVTAIAVAQSNSPGALLGDNIEIAHNLFFNNGIDSNDHSGVYMWANNVRVHNNVFSHPVMSGGVLGPIAAAELHGSQNWFNNNTVRNYLWGVYVAGNFTSVARGQFVQGNDFFVAQKAICMFNETPSEPGMADVVITGNNAWLTGDHTHVDGSAKKCFDLSSSQGEVDGLVVANNTLFTTDTYGAVAIKVGVLATGRAIKNVLIDGNITKGFGTPIDIGTTGGGSIQTAKVSNNLLADIRTNDTAPTFTIGVYVHGVNGSIEVTGNKADGAGAQPYFGVYLEGSMASLTTRGNTSNGPVGVNDLSTVSGRRMGDQATTFSALPSQSTWRAGDVVLLAGRPLLGTSPNKYTVDGWTRLTDGTANVLGTDWAERRVPTGL